MEELELENTQAVLNAKTWDIDKELKIPIWELSLNWQTVMYLKPDQVKQLHEYLGKQLNNIP